MDPQNEQPIIIDALVDGHIEPQNQQPQLPLNMGDAEPTDIFKKAATHFNFTNAVLLIYSVFKLILGIIFNIMAKFDQSCQSQFGLTNWYLWISIHSIFSSIYYAMLVAWLSKERNRNLVALRLNETTYQQANAQPLRGLQESKRISILTMQIKYEVQKENCCSKQINRLCFVGFQVLFIWGLMIFFQSYGLTLGCETTMYRFLIIILFFGLYQFIDFYLIAILVVICSPFLVIFLIYYLFSLCLKEKQDAQVIQALVKEKYTPNLLQGDQQCCICYTAYELQEEVITLKCSKIHHFHSTCIQAWLRVQRTCPLCRATVEAHVESEQ